jgi:hypothetical protein
LHFFVGELYLDFTPQSIQPRKNTCTRVFRNPNKNYGFCIAHSTNLLIIHYSLYYVTN